MSKKTVFFLVLLCTATLCHAQTKDLVNDSLMTDISERLAVLEYRLVMVDRFKLYKTENMYNLLKLDTATGKIEQIQWSLEDGEEEIKTINDKDLTNGTASFSGVFELYPTNNIYQFILLDRITGNSWHVQWGLESSKRWIRRIY